MPNWKTNLAPQCFTNGAFGDMGLPYPLSNHHGTSVIATFHNHSKWSDGNTGFDEIYFCANRLGVDILGLSDHFCVYPDGSSPPWSLAPQRAEDYLTDVLSFRQRGPIEIRVGLEFDWFENHHDIIAPVANRIPLDYRIGSVHHVEQQQFDMSASYWTEKSVEERDMVFVKYWNLIREMAESSLFDVVGHLDLPKKLGFHPRSDLNAELEAALDAIAESEMVVELNTAGFAKPCADGYPSLDILKKCRRREIPVTLSADAHSPEQILFEYERGLAQLRAAGFTSVARFRERERWFEPLGDALKSARP
jgi:histidinol-phosphatase (PHP family)